MAEWQLESNDARCMKTINADEWNHWIKIMNLKLSDSGAISNALFQIRFQLFLGGQWESRERSTRLIVWSGTWFTAISSSSQSLISPKYSRSDCRPNWELSARSDSAAWCILVLIVDLILWILFWITFWISFCEFNSHSRSQVEPHRMPINGGPAQCTVHSQSSFHFSATIHRL